MGMKELQAIPEIDGATLIVMERRRQMLEEGWDWRHDDEHESGQLARAAECYCHAAHTAMFRDDAARYHRSESGVPRGLGGSWPWENEWWKPNNDPIRNLVKAGALIAAEIDRLKRLKEVESDEVAGRDG